MKFFKIFAVVAFAASTFSFVGSAEAATRVRGYYKPSTGAYVAPSVRTSPNYTKLDNYSTKGNYNPYTGKSGTVDPYRPTIRTR